MSFTGLLPWCPRKHPHSRHNGAHRADRGPGYRRGQSNQGPPGRSPFGLRGGLLFSPGRVWGEWLAERMLLLSHLITWHLGTFHAAANIQPSRPGRGRGRGRSQGLGAPALVLTPGPGVSVSESRALGSTASQGGNCQTPHVSPGHTDCGDGRLRGRRRQGRRDGTGLSRGADAVLSSTALRAGDPPGAAVDALGPPASSPGITYSAQALLNHSVLERPVPDGGRREDPQSPSSSAPPRTLGLPP